jgi:hypothetical protein
LRVARSVVCITENLSNTYRAVFVTEAEGEINIEIATPSKARTIIGTWNC